MEWQLNVRWGEHLFSTWHISNRQLYYWYKVMLNQIPNERKRVLMRGLHIPVQIGQIFLIGGGSVHWQRSINTTTTTTTNKDYLINLNHRNKRLANLNWNMQISLSGPKYCITFHFRSCTHRAGQLFMLYHPIAIMYWYLVNYWHYLVTVLLKSTLK